MTIKSIKTEKNKSFILRLLKNMYWKYRKYTKIGISSFKMAHQSKDPKIFIKAIKLYRRDGFLPQEAFKLGLLNGHYSSKKISECTSRVKMTEVQESINPVQWEHLTEDKGIFYKHCTALGIPTPRLYAIFFKRTSGLACEGSLLTGPDDWKKFIERQLPSEFVIKPARGVYGRELDIFCRNGSGFLNSCGELYKAKDIYDIILSSSRYDSFIIQERVINHPDIARLTDAKGLQTVRAITFIKPNGNCILLLAHLKVIIGDNIVDNTEHGKTENMQALISLADGIIKTPAVMMTADGSGPKTVPVHPKTGLRFEGFQLPLWHDLCDLAIDSAKKFLPVRTIGWDVAVTSKGPVIVEANMFWDPPNAHKRMEEVLGGLLC